MTGRQKVYGSGVVGPESSVVRTKRRGGATSLTDGCVSPPPKWTLPIADLAFSVPRIFYNTYRRPAEALFGGILQTFSDFYVTGRVFVMLERF